MAQSAHTGVSFGTVSEVGYQDMKEQVATELKEQFRPEFLNRLDDIIVFRQLTEPQVRQIVDIEVKKINDRIFERHMIIDITDKAKDLLAEKGFEPLLGARPLRRVIQRDIEDAIAEQMLMGELKENNRIVVDAKGEGASAQFTFSSEPFKDSKAENSSGSESDGESDGESESASGESANSGESDSNADDSGNGSDNNSGAGSDNSTDGNSDDSVS